MGASLFSQVPKHAALVTPSNTTEQTFAGLRANGAGNVNVKTEGGETVLIPMLAGEWLILSGTMVLATNTTATGLLRVW